MGLFDYAMNIGKKLFNTATEALAVLKKRVMGQICDLLI